jgi:hypothetical protein
MKIPWQRIIVSGFIVTAFWAVVLSAPCAAFDTLAQHKVMNEVRGVQLGMKQADVQAKLGKPVSSSGEADEFKLEGEDLMTVRYENGTVVAIQLLILDPKNAPPFNQVVGDAEIEQQDSGRKIARKVLDAEKYWVSMSQSKDASMTNITIRKM